MGSEEQMAERAANEQGERNHRGQNLDAPCGGCGHAFREHADGLCLWPVGEELDECGCTEFKEAR